MTERNWAVPSERSLADVVKDLEAQLYVLQAKEEIRLLTARYNQAFDDMDLDGYAGTFTPDGEFVLDDGEPIRGRAAITEFHRGIGFGKVHATADHAIQVDGDSATQVCNLLLGSRSKHREVGSARLDNSGRYFDDLVRTPQGWLFAKRTWIPDAALPD